MNTTNGGPAFAAEGSITTDCYNVPTSFTLSGGMTMRDWFAGLAMQAMLTNPEIEKLPQADAQGIAKFAYSQSDAMIAERNKV